MVWTNFTKREAVNLTMMTVSHARKWLIINHPEVTEAEREEYLAENADLFLAVDIGNYNTDDILQKKCTTVLFLCGASLRQIAHLYAVSPQAISNRIDRELGTYSNRMAMRLRQPYPQLTLERISELKRMFYNLAATLGVEDILRVSAVSIARSISTQPSTVEIPDAATQRLATAQADPADVLERMAAIEQQGRAQPSAQKIDDALRDGNLVD